MNTLDEEAFEREMSHADMMQGQRKTVTFAGGHRYEVPADIYDNSFAQIKDNDNE